MIGKKKINLFRIIIYVIVILFVISIFPHIRSLFPHNYSDEENIEYLKTRLYEKYHINFQFLKQEHNEKGREELYYFSPENKKDMQTLYYFLPENNADIVVTTYCGETNNPGMIGTIIPVVPYKRYSEDNFEEAIAEKVIAKSKIQKIDLRELVNIDNTELEVIAEDIYELIAEIDKNCEVYGISAGRVRLKVYGYDGEQIRYQYFRDNKSSIYNTLKDLIKENIQ